MADVFACPECGRELEVGGYSPGRAVRCGACSTWVEVPFLPRSGGWKRARGAGRGRRSPWASSKALRGAIVLAAVAVAGLVASLAIGGRVRSGRERVLAELVASAGRAESSGRYDVALREIEGAVAQARTFEREGSGRLDDLEGQRARVSLLEARARLAGVWSMEPDRAVGESLILADRARRDPALGPIAVAIAGAVEGSRARQAEADLALARQALESGRDADAVADAARLHDRAARMAGPEAGRFRDEARAVIEAAVGRSGVALSPVDGRFAAGSAEGYASAIGRIRDESLRARGYLPQPRNSPWASTWDEKAPFRATLQVAETREALYLQSKNRSTQIDATLELLHGDRVAWKSRVVAATREPLPDLPAYLAGHLATAARRDPEIERRLHADALAQFIDRVARSLRNLPGRESAARAP